MMPNLRRKTLMDVINATVIAAMKELLAFASNCSRIRRKLIRNLKPMELRALDDCLKLLSVTVSQLNTILANLSATNLTETAHYEDLQTLLSGAMTNQYTCIDGFAHSGNTTRRIMKAGFDKIINKEIPATIVNEDDKDYYAEVGHCSVFKRFTKLVLFPLQVLAFRDIAPQAPTHILLNPKVKDGFESAFHGTELGEGAEGDEE